MRHAIFLLLLAGLGAAGLSGPRADDGSPAEILWDRYGVPHIFAPDPESLFYAFGWAQMEAHGDLILRLYGEARGHASEYWGEKHLDVDRWVRRMGVPARARVWYDAQEDAERRRLDAFVAGINAYATAHPDRIADDVEVVLPVTAPDVIAHGQRVILFEFVTSRDAVNQSTSRWSKGGSNAWAIAPSRAAGGHAMLVDNPHLPWSDFFRWFEAQLVSPQFDAYGAALVGNPLLGIAFNDRLGWTHTNNTMDGADLYELTLDGDGYRWDDGPAEARTAEAVRYIRKFDTETQTIRVKQKDGTLRDELLVIRRSIHGPVVAEKPGPLDKLGAGKAIALRVVGLDQPHIGEQYWDMARAKSLDEFQRAVRRLQNPFYTVMYADRDGHIMHLFGGRTPVRPAGDFDWSGIVPGDSPRTLWAATHPYEALPCVVDPPSGWLQNANDPPWTTTFPAAIRADDFPRDMAPRAMSFRAQRSARMLDEDKSITYDELIAYKHSTRMELADRILDDLLPIAARAALRPFDPSTLRPFDKLRVVPSAVEGRQAQGRPERSRGTTGSGSPRARSRGDKLRVVPSKVEGRPGQGAPSSSRGGGAAAEAGAALERWDRAADAGSRGAVLFDRFWRELQRISGRAGAFATPWNEHAPRTTPDGLRRADDAVKALEAAVASMRADGLAIDVAWGDVYRLRGDGSRGTGAPGPSIDLPANGGPSSLGIFRVVGFRKEDDGKFAAAGGDSFVAAIEFGTPVRAMTLVAPGNWSQPGSPHRADQLQLFSQKKLRPVLRTRQQIEGNLERIERVRGG